MAAKQLLLLLLPLLLLLLFGGYWLGKLNRALSIERHARRFVNLPAEEPLRVEVYGLLAEPLLVVLVALGLPLLLPPAEFDMMEADCMKRSRLLK